MTPHGFKWICRPARIRGEDFEYEALVLCCFPKSSGKIRYIVEDRGRLFIQREEQITYLQSADLVALEKTERVGNVEVRRRVYESHRPEGLEAAGPGQGCPHCGHRHPPDGVCV